MRIAYITTYDARDRGHWSGLGYYIAEMLKSQGNEIVYFGNLPYRPSYLDKIRNKLNIVFRRPNPFDRNFSVSKNYGKYLEGKLDDFDIVFSPGTIPLSFLTTKRPIVFYTDATFAGMVNFYDGFSKLNKNCIKIGNLLEQKALDNCSLAIYASDWAATTAKSFYKIPEGKVKVVPFGANIEAIPSFDAVNQNIKKRVLDSTCNLLFVGVDWQRKGGDKVFDVVKQMLNQGERVKLHIVGTTEFVLEESLKPYVEIYGFLSKSNPQDCDVLDYLYNICHFFIMLPKAECYGLVYCEAGAYGLPSIAIDTGGVGTIIKNDINGFLYNQDVSAEVIAKEIGITFSNKESYFNLSLSAYQYFKAELNWFVAGKKVQDELYRLKHKFSYLED